jgi:methylated-DNA-protein-cysteine methyltransferase-like protein
MPTELTLRTIAVLKKIPRGKVVSYGLVAAMAGNPRAARQVVRTLNTSSEKEKLPWHRVINSQGKIALKRGQGFELQKSLLEKEGVKVTPGGQINLAKYLWSPKPATRASKPRVRKKP